MLIVQRWVLARLRRRRFFSLDELNQAIWELLEELNAKPFQKLEGCRNSAFEKLDRPALRALPPLRYEFADRLDVGVNIDYHVEFDKRYYSVHHTRIHQRVEVRATAAIVEIFYDSERIASHRTVAAMVRSARLSSIDSSGVTREFVDFLQVGTTRAPDPSLISGGLRHVPSRRCLLPTTGLLAPARSPVPVHESYVDVPNSLTPRGPVAPSPRCSELRHGHPHDLKALAPSNIVVSRLDRPARPRTLLRFAPSVARRHARTGFPGGGLLPG